MRNSTKVLYFTLSAYDDSGPVKYVFFLLLLFLYVCIVVANVLLIAVICVNRSLHQPMYLFLCSLFVNELFGSSGLFPFLLLQIVSDVHTVPAAACFLQIFCLHSYGTVEFMNLAVMSYDRYLAICRPLQYNRQMTLMKVSLLVAASWFISFLLNLLTVSLSSTLQLCGDVIDKVFCVNYSIVKLACSDITVNNVYGLIGTCLVVFAPLSLILYSYIKILKICFSGCRQTRQRAVSTCSPHLASLLNFSFGASFEILQSRFDMSSLPGLLRTFLSLYWLMCQPLFNPALYGLKMSAIHAVCKRLIPWKTRNIR